MLAIITARGGSKRIPRKNIKDFLGKPILAYSIEVALASGLFEEVMVSTDDEEIAQVAQQYGAKVPFLRSATNADDFAGTSEVLLEVLAQYAEVGKTFAYGCCLYPTAPFITVKRLKEAFQLLRIQQYSTVFPVTRFNAPIQRALRVEENQQVQLFAPENYHKRSQDLEPAYYDAGQFYWFDTEKFLVAKELWTPHSGVIVLPQTEVQDIDEPEDWKLAELKFRWKQQQKNNT